MSDLRKIECTGIVWYEEADYPQVLRVMSDAHLLPPTFASWHQKASQGLQIFEKRGGVAIKATLRAAEFKAWCVSLNIKPDAQARMRFANEAALRHIEGMKGH